jgi:membrane associated rhomboid family serine protease
MQSGGILDEFRNAFSKPNNSLFQIIWINAAVFVILNSLRVVLWLTGSGGLGPCQGDSTDFFCVFMGFLEIPASLSKFIIQPWTLITYFFTHLGFFHILFNMLFLYWFGKLIQEFLGDKKVLNLYVLGGIAGGLFYMLIYNILPQFGLAIEYSYMLGASAGVFAIVVGAAVFMPDYTMYLLLFGPVRIKYIALVYVLLSFFSIPVENAGGNIAHLGGAAIGFIYIKQLQKGNDFGGWITKIISFFKSFFIRQPKIKVSYSSGDQPGSKSKGSQKKKSAKSGGANVPNQAEIDIILDKISQSGYESLSKEEKQKLFNASKK